MVAAELSGISAPIASQSFVIFRLVNATVCEKELEHEGHDCMSMYRYDCGPGTNTVLEGQIDSINSTELRHISVHLRGPYPTSGDITAELTSSGEFRVAQITPGTYTLQVLDSFGHQIVSQSVEVTHAGTHVSIELPVSDNTPNAGWSVSLATLLHKPKPAAFKACLRAQKYSEARDYQRAAAELQKAVALDPLYAPAHGNLGAQYARLKRLDSAEGELRKAIQLDPATGLYYSDLAWVLADEKQTREAEIAARRAVDLDGVNAMSQLLPGYLLANRPEARAAAVPHLMFAARQIPEAHRILVDTYHMIGNEPQALEETEHYIGCPCRRGFGREVKARTAN